MKDGTPLPEASGLGWLDASGDRPDIVLSTRLRLARNLQGHAFGTRARVNDRISVLEQVQEASGRAPLLGDATLLQISELQRRQARLLVERRLVSRELLGPADGEPRPGAAVLLSAEHPLSIMVNEEDHLRLQAIRSGLDLRQAWNLVDALDEEVGRELPLAYHPEFGFLTSCPTNVGTGLRASVLLHLPALVLTKEIGKVLQGLSQVGLTFRGLHGEGSEVVGNFFQLSNQTTLGRTEEDLVDHLERMVQQVIHYELQAREVLLRDAAAETEDKIWRAYGLLRHARSLPFDELMNLLSGVRLGVGLKLLPGLRVYPLNKIMVFTQPAHLEEVASRDLPTAEADVHRATYVRRILANEGVVGTEGASGDPSPAPGD